MLIFTDGSSNGIAAIQINNQVTPWQTGLTSAQAVELSAVLLALEESQNQRFNLYSDSQYVVLALQILENVPFIGVTTSEIQGLFIAVQKALRARTEPCYFGHLRAHSNLPGPLSEGNERVDQATQIWLSQEQAAQASHALHHQNSRSLRLQFSITREAARQIVKQCPTCPQLHPVPQFGINPRGLLPNHLWQMDVTHIPSFGKMKYVHVTVDTYSGFLHATVQSRESSSHCIAHCLRCFAVMGVPKELKTDNGPGYTSDLDLSVLNFL